MKIRLKTINDVNGFSKACSDYYAGDIDIKQDRQVIDGKSVLGIYSLDLTRPIDVTISTIDESIERDFYNFIKRWHVNGEW